MLRPHPKCHILDEEKDTASDSVSRDDEMPNTVDPQLMLDILNEKRNNPSAFVSGWIEDDETGIVPDEDVEEHLDRKLLKACEDGDIAVVEELLSKDSSLVNARDRDQYTPLHRASYGNHVAVIKLLLQYGADVSAKTEEGWHPLHCAARWGNVDAVKILLHMGKADLNAGTNGNLTPLHLAASEPVSLYVAEYLLCQKGIDPSIKSHANETALDVARRTSQPMYDLFLGMCQPMESESRDATSQSASEISR
ncbi:Ank 2 domain containing protein [Trichuris trichiura]|uniref:Ank 2 domain containing protein n=1 Tax=Trichuris trichiura TaxID=36087 RepID=A0A077ZET0_TRITR|nr:Ank 2 domain containing protein [Trichuris trichiura]